MTLRSAVSHVLSESERLTPPPLPDCALARLQGRGPLVGAEADDPAAADNASDLPPATLQAASLSPPQRRGAYRVGVALRATVAWPDPESANVLEGVQGVVVNLSGSGAQVRLQQMPPLDSVLLSIDPPDAFVEDRALCQLCRPGGTALFPTLGSSGFRQVGESVRSSLRSVESRIVYARTHVIEPTSPVFVLSLAFLDPQDGCYRLVRFLERLSLKADRGRLNPLPTQMAQLRV